jgi:hypothetical protein
MSEAIPPLPQYIFTACHGDYVRTGKTLQVPSVAVVVGVVHSGFRRSSLTSQVTMSRKLSSHVKCRVVVMPLFYRYRDKKYLNKTCTLFNDLLPVRTSVPYIQWQYGCSHLTSSLCRHDGITYD